MKSLLLLTLIISIIVINGKQIKIGIVGAGVGGSSCAYYLKEALGDEIEVTVFEKHVVGGRAHIVEIDGAPVELGGSVIHKLNENINQLVDRLGLTTYNPESNSSYAIFNGNQLIFENSYFSFMDTIKLLYTYKFDPIRFQAKRDKVVNQFLKSYKIDEPFKSVQQFFDQIELPDICKVTAKSYLMDDGGIGAPFVEDILSAAIRVNYNQDYDKIAAFAAFIALVGAEDNLYSIKGGNYLLPKACLQKSNVKLIQDNVKLIEKLENGEYKIKLENQGEFMFDKIVIATPIELSNIEFKGDFKVDIDNIPHREYKTVHTYLIPAKSINPAYLNLPIDTVNVPEHILTSHNTSIPFYVASRNPRGMLKDGRILFKVFSHLELDDKFFSTLFLNHSIHTKKSWKAYPILSPSNEFPPIVLDDSIYYLNSFEHAVSTMETETISSKNIVKLIIKSLHPTNYKSKFQSLDLKSKKDSSKIEL